MELPFTFLYLRWRRQDGAREACFNCLYPEYAPSPESRAFFQGAVFIVPARGKGEKPIILFRGYDTPFRSDQGALSPKAKPELTYFGLALRRIMKNMGYHFEYPRGFNGGKGITTPLKPYPKKDQEEATASGGDIYLRPYGLGYKLPIMRPSDSESEISVSERKGLLLPLPRVGGRL